MQMKSEVILKYVTLALVLSLMSRISLSLRDKIKKVTVHSLYIIQEFLHLSMLKLPGSLTLAIKGIVYNIWD